jgi:hypothetical protein
MMLREPCVHPPQVASWLVDLFAPEEQAESITGDLLEEFSDLASKSGVAFARRWYWRQSVRTIVHLMGTGFRFAPWRIAGAVVGGFLLYWFGAGKIEQVVVAVVDFRRQPHVTPYYTWPQVQARMFWVKYGVLAGYLLLSFFIGCIVAIAVKGREMVAAITLGLVLWVPQAAWFFAWSAKHGYAFLPLQLIIALGVSIMTVTGGGIVRKSRSAGRASVSSSRLTGNLGAGPPLPQ